MENQPFESMQESYCSSVLWLILLDGLATHNWKLMLVKLDDFPKDRGKTKINRSLKPLQFAMKNPQQNVGETESRNYRIWLTQQNRNNSTQPVK